MNRAGDEFGLERLTESAVRHRQKKAEDIVKDVLVEVDDFSRGGTHEDDRVVLILKVS